MEYRRDGVMEYWSDVGRARLPSVKEPWSYEPFAVRATWRAAVWPSRGNVAGVERPFRQPQPRGRGVQFGLGAVLPHSNTPSLRVAGFEDEDEDEAPCEATGGFTAKRL